ncbi:glycine cleavage system protein T [Halobellus salinus]|uniref:Glycine cleavage system protein T n=1 Tax=Halobellus salinus TaxID=931585 RepID=A0A830EIL5_9EURY|nr:glycine cleavage T C-terminal barrel domain-containing protein [Halobellus salinus]GGJ08613.1 glycine cleavage system protein T [Halobellus salinus]SMP28297.1 aminomethyltransferase [Halobellus salinus]
MSGHDPHPNHSSVDQSDRTVPRNLRQTGDADIDLVISTRVRKSPFWHLSVEEGCHEATVYNHMYHPRAYIDPEDGGAEAEYDLLVNDVALWDVAVERQIRVEGPDAEAFVNRVITRDATDIDTKRGKYAICCNQDGGILNDFVLLRPDEDEFWFSLADGDLLQWLQGIDYGTGFDVDIDEIDVSPMQVQGPKSPDVIESLIDAAVEDVPYYGLLEATIGGVSVLVSQTGFSGEAGFEIYVREATENAEAVWNPVLETVTDHGGAAAPVNGRRRIAAGILSLGQDMDHEMSPFQVNLGYQVPDDKNAEYVGKAELEHQKNAIEDSEFPFTHKLVGLKMAGEPIIDWASDFWIISDPETGEECGYLTSAGWNPDLEANVALGYVPAAKLQAATDVPLDDSVYNADIDLEFAVHLPDEYAETPGEPVYATVAEVPFKQSENPSAREQAKIHSGDGGDE